MKVSGRGSAAPGTPPLTVRPDAPDSADARACLVAYFAELDRRFDGGFALDESVWAGAAELAPPLGLFLLARIGDEPVGCAGLKWIDDEVAEIRRMWVSPASRGRGVARAMLRAAEAATRDSGRSILRLDTNEALWEARALYGREGFASVPRFNDNSYAHHWFAKPV